MNLNKQMLTKQLLLARIQDIDIYSFYTEQEVELKKAILSPLREEKNPSFGYFIGENNEICFRDFTLGAGDCIKFVELLFGLNHYEALSKIAIDFNFQDDFYVKQVAKTSKDYKPVINDIRDAIMKKSNNFRLGKTRRDWMLHDTMYWLQYGINRDTLSRYRVEPISYIHLNGSPIKVDKYAYCFIEKKDNKDTYKIYQPFNKQYKWLNNHDSSVWQGWEQLPETGEELIITKSLKDVMSIVSVLGIPAVSLQSESSRPKDHIMDELKRRFKTVYIMYDNDYDQETNWGQMHATSLAKQYKLINVEIPTHFKCKDFSDLVKNIDSIAIPEWDDKKLTKKEKTKLVWECNIQMPF